MNEQDIEQLAEKLLGLVPGDGSPIGNKALRDALKWPPDQYWSTRNQLVSRGELQVGKGKGGSVRRVLNTAVTPSEPEENRSTPDTGGSHGGGGVWSESSLYGPMAEVLKNSWSVAEGFDDVVVQITAQQGSKATGGKWSRPDIAVATLSTFPYVPGRHFGVVTFEVKAAAGIDITCVYEALAHLRAATESYVLLHVPAEEQIESILSDICDEARRHGVGVIVAENPNDYDTWEEKVEPVRLEPNRRRLNEFLGSQLSKSQLEKLMKWFK